MVHLMKSSTFPLLVLLATASMICNATPPPVQSTSSEVEILAVWHDTMPDNSLNNDRIVLAFHNGEFDAFDRGQPLPPFLRNWIPSDFLPADAFIENFFQNYPDAELGLIWNPKPNGLGHIIGTPPWKALVTLDPEKHRFLSYVFRLYPANDAFVANEDPFEIELFDSEGKFKGPLYIDVFGNQTVDAGLCRNDEAVLTRLDVGLWDEQTCDPENGVVMPHPGLNGSWRNPDGSPQRVLGGTGHFHHDNPALNPHYDAQRADFSRPGYKIGRLLITRRWSSGYTSGSYYSPERAGEGFNIELVEPEPGQPHTRILVYWYTFKPDGSGEQVWLAGMGEMDADGGIASDVEMYVTTGGEFASTGNPDLVDRQRWGTIRIGFGDCGHGRVFYQPDDPDWPSGDYFINRLSPQIEGLGWPCALPDEARLILPED
ncbi:spondin domain-containing protein [Pseudofulvimonas gallinarii]|nr:spondin domain-containing protein [Pseudofulvimonas gallinarii]